MADENPDKEEKQENQEDKSPPIDKKVIKLIALMSGIFLLILIITIVVLVIVLKQDPPPPPPVVPQATTNVQVDAENTNKKKKQSNIDDEDEDEDEDEDDDEDFDEELDDLGDDMIEPDLDNPKIFFKIPKFAVNLDSRSKANYLQIEIYLEIESQDDIKDIEDYLPLIKNDLINLFSQKRYKDLYSSSGKDKAKDESLEIISNIMENEVGKNGVKNLFFSSFVMQ